MFKLWIVLLVIVLSSDAFIIIRTKRDAEFQEQEVKIIPTKIDINRLKEEAYATKSAGERFLPGITIGERRKK